MTARPQDVALLPCPFCGLDVTDDEGCFPLNRERTKWEVRCGNPSCFAHDPCDESRHAAIARWNRRSDAALASAQAREDELWAEVERWRSTAVFGACGLSDHLTAMEERATAAEARAERLEEALREAEPIVEWAETESYSEFSDYELSARCEKLLVTIRSLLSTNAATQTGETT